MCRLLGEALTITDPAVANGGGTKSTESFMSQLSLSSFAPLVLF
jgi:hypothetical protein